MAFCSFLIWWAFFQGCCTLSVGRTGDSSAGSAPQWQTENWPASNLPVSSYCMQTHVSMGNLKKLHPHGSVDPNDATITIRSGDQKIIGCRWTNFAEAWCPLVALAFICYLNILTSWTLQHAILVCLNILNWVISSMSLMCTTISLQVSLSYVIISCDENMHCV